MQTPTSIVDTSWLERNEFVKQFVPAGSTVVDYGCLHRSILNYISPVKYLGIDINGSPDIVHDLNTGIPTDIGHWDIGLILGVLEYLQDPEKFLLEASATADTVIVLCLLRDKPKELWRNSWNMREFTKMISNTFTNYELHRYNQYCVAVCSTKKK
jgi:hypothetical protein